MTSLSWHVCLNKQGRHLFRWWPVACSVPSHSSSKPMPSYCKLYTLCLDLRVLTDWGSISHTRIIWMGHHWFRYWRVVYQALDYHQLQTWHMTYCKIRWNWNQNTFVFERKTVQKTVCKNQQVCSSSVLTRDYWKPEDYAFPYSYTTGKKYGIFLISSIFLQFCGLCRVFLYLKYIPTSRYYFWGS